MNIKNIKNKKYFIANWKMNNGLSATSQYLAELSSSLTSLYLDSVEFVICPSLPYLYLFDEIRKRGVKIGAQDVSSFQQGAYTGEVSSVMLGDFGVSFCIIGHSERRNLLLEGNEILSAKLNNLGSGIVPIFCIGESLAERKSGSYLEKLAQQLEVIKSYDKQILVAYEPVWAIGTGVSANNSEIEEAFLFISRELSGKEFSILYGGSVNDDNVNELTKIKELDGFLVGNASLKLDSSLNIYNKLVGV